MRDAVGRLSRVLVLGGTSEIGLAIVRRLLDDGLERVLLAGRDEAALHAAAATLPSGVAGVLAFDASRPETHRATVERAFAEGDVDVVVMAVGVLPDQAMLESEPERAAELGVTNFTGPMTACLLVAQRLRHQGHGTLVVLSSVAAMRARPANYLYGATKAGLDAFAEGLGHRLRGSGAGLLLVRPGFVRTRMTHGMPDAPMSVGPEEVAAAVAEGLRAGRSSVWVPRPLALVGLLLRLLPSRVVARLRA